MRIKRPRAAVHALIADLARHEEYLDHFLVEWTMTSEQTRGPGATGRLRAKGGGSDDIVDFAITAMSDSEIVLESRSGRRGHRRMRLVYALEEVADGVTQVTFALYLVAGSIVDRATWSLPRSHLERQAMLRLKGLLEGEPRAV